MTHPGHDPLPRLADALTEVSGRLREIGDEIRVLRAAPAPTPPPVAAPFPQPFPQPAAPPFVPPPFVPPFAGSPAGRPPAPPQPAWVPPPPQPGWQVAAVPPPPRPPRERRVPTPAGPTLWERLGREGAGSRLLAWVGGGVTLAGVVLLLVLAVQRGYIGPLPRVLVGAALAGALVGIGLVLHRREASRVGANAVAATGVAGLYLDIVAATAVYPFLSAWGGLVVGLGVAALGTAIAYRWNSQLFACFVVLGCALSAPVVTGGVDGLLVGFLLALQVASGPVHVTRRWSWLALSASVPPLLAALTLVAATRGGSGDVVAVVTLGAVTGVVQLATGLVAALRGTSETAAIGLLAGAPLPTLFGAALLTPRAGALVVGGFGALLALVWVLHRVRVLRVTDAVALTAGAGAAVAAFEAVCLGFAGDARTLALLAAATLLAVLGDRLRYAGAVVAATAFGGVGLIAALDTVVPLAFLAWPPRGHVDVWQIATAITTGVLVVIAAATLGRAAGRVVHDQDATGPRLRWTAAGVVMLYGGSTSLLGVGLAVRPDEQGFLVGHVLVTVSWSVAALVLLVRRFDSTPFRVAGLALVAAAVGKLVLFDLASLTGLPRVLAFLGAGLVLLGTGTRYATLAANGERGTRPA
ncbi:Predicted membrane protein [Jatrophihabitans endophyticus]|uniref:Predicted membrane protein n=1 Tax=Jatrophihabitans endophyticus TaxID=1206085 RepID=A0A1M5RUR7_9ACTN|nr:DUF2339 domain-containing protein [Jatrophihabitans endophyticus]SHH30072.1 Predicted membrane protein [Jatrophihabitans endophyticus]